MKVFLICPAERPEVAALAETTPLSNVALFGKPFAHHWMEHLARIGVSEVTVLATDRPEQTRKVIGDGARWGLRAEVIPESHELTMAEAKEKYFPNDTNSECPVQLELMDHLPGFPNQNVFESYPGFYSALQFWFSQKPFQNQIGVTEIKPGIWAGMRTHISPDAQLFPPCWIGENVLIKRDATIGPMAILENNVLVETAATIYESWIGSGTFAGSLVQIKDSLAIGNSLVSLRTDSVAKVPDNFLLCALKDRQSFIRRGSLLGRIAALIVLVLTSPFAIFTILKARWQGFRAVRVRRANAPHFMAETRSTITYFEFANANGWWRRWPQLWNVVRGEFAWIGNRPLTLIDAGKLTNDFERLWLAAPVGLISQGDAEGCSDISSDEAKAHAVFYAAQSTWKLDCRIFFRALRHLLWRKPRVESPGELADAKSRAVAMSRAVTR